MVLLRAKTYHKANCRSYPLQPSHASRCKISLACKVGACTESKIYYSFSLLPSFFAFLASFFSLSGHLVGIILVGKVSKKAFRILGIDDRKGRWVVEQDFHGNFQVNVTWFFDFFSGVLDWIGIIFVWVERSLHSAQVSRQSCLWLLKLMTSQAVESTWTGIGGYRRGKWVKTTTLRPKDSGHSELECCINQ